MRTLMLIAVVLGLALPFSGCEAKKSGLAGKAEAAREKEDKAAAEAAAAKLKAEQEVFKAAEERVAKQEAARAAARADQAEGNAKTTEDIATTEDEKAIIGALAKGGAFEQVAKDGKKKRAVYEPLLIKALRHGSSNVRTQAARVFNINGWKNEAVTAALSDAMLAEADDVVRENWGSDFRLYLSLEADKGAEITTDLMPAMHKAFTRAQSPGAFSTLAETLMKHQYKPAVPDIYKKLDASTEDTAKTQFLLAALKRFPQESHLKAIERYFSHSTPLVRQRAKEVKESVLMAREAAEKPAEPAK